jgi:hypothetical protein
MGFEGRPRSMDMPLTGAAFFGDPLFAPRTPTIMLCGRRAGDPFVLDVELFFFIESGSTAVVALLGVVVIPSPRTLPVFAKT